MIERIRTRALWLAVGIVFGGGAFAFAGAANVGSTTKEKPPTVTAEDDAAESAKESKVETEDEGTPGEHPENHGKYVSAAAHCEDVTDDENDITFTAPEDCDSNGKAHGRYVSQVARSGAGKAPKDRPNGTDD